MWSTSSRRSAPSRRGRTSTCTASAAPAGAGPGTTAPPGWGAPTAPRTRPAAAAGSPARRPAAAGANGALQALGVDVETAGALAGVDLVHSHTWYANAAGVFSSLVHGVPHVITAHSLEPRRPWKADQLGGGYRLSSWVERTA